ncbi:MAG: bacillithiol biosynthesis deacetylase BshB1 [Marinoscillum sp.]|uniref:bacillithiol biosynthesis deacetylase BshB1 n=1 Tax=Marinoscillum sp. TaxID=2024838 RepID=UPI0032FBBA13
MKINILAFAAHPDDVELSCAGTLIVHQMRGFTTGIIDLTQGEMGTRGTAEQRLQEAQRAGEIMKVSVRENLGFADSFFTNDAEHQLKIVQKIREFQPDIVLTNALYDRHPDHGRAAALVEEACFKAGLKKVETLDADGKPQKAWRPKKTYFCIQSTSLTPDFLVDISDAQELKMEAVHAYKSQFFDPNSQEPQTYISKPEFIQMIEARAIEYGHRIGVKYAEGFMTKQPLGVKDLYHLI